jgi:methylmalonyl-CoA mutase
MATGVYNKALGSSAGAEVAAVERAVARFEAEAGRRPRILIAKMGQDGHDRGAKVMATG